ncbi:MAG: hypothetical protein LBR78_01485 [Holosporales bacterium]|jgi:hypothetical protein|nr:hypothetical protein [Holosporales bacterium]
MQEVIAQQTWQIKKLGALVCKYEKLSREILGRIETIPMSIPKGGGYDLNEVWAIHDMLNHCQIRWARERGADGMDIQGYQN